MEHNIDRRQFLKYSAAGAGGLVIGYLMPPGMERAFADAPKTPGPNLNFTNNSLPNAFVKIGSDNSVKLIINKLEMGQGVFTSLAQLIAEELECDWKQIQCETAPVNPVYNHVFRPMQLTGGSSSVASSWEQHRMIGAMAREMLISAAAQKWDVPREQCHASNGSVHCKDKSATFGALAEAASSQPAPEKIRLKDPKHFKIIGKSMQRLDVDGKVNGQAIFGLDVKRPDMQYACLARPPFGAKLKSFNESAAKKIPGVTKVLKLGDIIAVVAQNTWSAKRGRDALEVQWNQDASQTSSKMMEKFKPLALQSGTPAKTDPQTHGVLKSSHKVETYEYEFPFLAHACMEPLNCTVDFNGQTAEIWSGHQAPTWDRAAAAKVLDIPPEKVSIHATFAGGGFGRRGSKTCDYVIEACQVARALKKPVKVVWTREDDMRGGYYRSLAYHRAQIGYTDKGKVTSWKHSIVVPSIMVGTPLAAMMKDGIDPTSVEGVADSPYTIPAFSVELHSPESAVPVLWWRSVGHTHTAYVMETLIDEIAAQMKRDPMALRKEWLKGSPRHMAVLHLLEQKSGWGKKPAKGHAFGLAIHQSFNSVVGHVVDVSLDGSDVRVHKVVSVVDCGTVVNPAGAKAQVASAIAYGLSACLFGEINVESGLSQQSNFHDYQVVRMNQMPAVDVHFVASSAAPTGLGEPGLPPIAPAVANAIFQLTRKRIRKLPFSKELAAT